MDFSFSSGGSRPRAAARAAKAARHRECRISESGGNTRWSARMLLRRPISLKRLPSPTGRKSSKAIPFPASAATTRSATPHREVAKAGGVDLNRPPPRSRPSIIAAMNCKQVDGVSLGPPWAQQVEHAVCGRPIANGVKGGARRPPQRGGATGDPAATLRRSSFDLREEGAQPNPRDVVYACSTAPGTPRHPQKTFSVPSIPRSWPIRSMTSCR